MEEASLGRVRLPKAFQAADHRTGHEGTRHTAPLVSRPTIHHRAYMQRPSAARDTHTLPHAAAEQPVEVVRPIRRAEGVVPPTAR